MPVTLDHRLRDTDLLNAIHLARTGRIRADSVVARACHELYEIRRALYLPDGRPVVEVIAKLVANLGTWRMTNKERAELEKVVDLMRPLLKRIPDTTQYVPPKKKKVAVKPKVKPKPRKKPAVRARKPVKRPPRPMYKPVLILAPEVPAVSVNGAPDWFAAHARGAK